MGPLSHSAKSLRGMYVMIETSIEIQKYYVFIVPKCRYINKDTIDYS